jgi:hypothetical protein
VPTVLESTATSIVSVPMPAGTARRIYAKSESRITATVTVLRNGIATSVKCDFASSTSCSNVVDSAVFAEGDTISFKVTSRTEIHWVTFSLGYA